MFFACRDAPFELCPENLRSLQLSLNTPVVRIENLPVAPARAALVLHGNATGELDVTLSVRSLKTGQVLHFAPDGELPDAARCIDAAMAFGEGMGFLFDEDELAAGDTERAFGIWAELMGDPPPRLPAAAPASPASVPEEPSFEFVLDDTEGEELLLVDAIEEAANDEAAWEYGPELASPSIASSETSSEVSPPPDTTLLTSMVEDALAVEPACSPPTAPTLTKFRRLASSPSEDSDAVNPPELDAEASESSDAPQQDDESIDASPQDDTPVLHAENPDLSEAPVPKHRRLRKAALGRLSLVKKRKPASDEERRQWLARILSAF